MLHIQRSSSVDGGAGAGRVLSSRILRFFGRLGCGWTIEAMKDDECAMDGGSKRSRASAARQRPHSINRLRCSAACGRPSTAIRHTRRRTALPSLFAIVALTALFIEPPIYQRISEFDFVRLSCTL